MSPGTVSKPVTPVPGAACSRKRRWGSLSLATRDSPASADETVTGGSLLPALVSRGTCEETAKLRFALQPVSGTTIRTRNTICGLRSYLRGDQVRQSSILFSGIRGGRREVDLTARTRSPYSSVRTHRSSLLAITRQ